jgi:hypothetical protein
MKHNVNFNATLSNFNFCIHFYCPDKFDSKSEVNVPKKEKNIFLF